MDKVERYFRTQNSGYDTCRTNEGMHESLYIPNNYQTILEAVEQF